MIPGKTYTPRDFINIAWRYRWLLIVPTLLFTIIAAVVSWYIPDKYRSETLVLVTPQRLPETYVRTTVAARIEERIRTIREQILSRSRLERIVEELELYQEDLGKLPMEVIIERMRPNVTTRVVRDDAFSVSFVDGNPEVAQKVTERLASMFGEENMKDREVIAESTNQFLATQLEEARARLVEHEKKVEEYRRRYSGELPEQVGSNLQAIQNAEMQIQSLLQSLNSDRDRRLIAERQLADVSSTETPLPAAIQATTPNAPMSTTEQLETAEINLRSLETKLTPQHPDLVAARATVQKLQARLNDEQRRIKEEAAASASALNSAQNRRLSAAESVRRNHMADLQRQIEGADRQIAGKIAEEERLRAIIAGYRAKVEAAPARETDLLALTRDYQTLQQQYQGLLKSYEESRVAANMERRQISGLQFRVLDAARVPERPFTPNRPLLTAVGAAGGLGIGMAIIFLLEFMDGTFRSAADVTACIQLPVLVTLQPISVPRRPGRRGPGRLFGSAGS